MFILRLPIIIDHNAYRLGLKYWINVESFKQLHGQSKDMSQHTLYYMNFIKTHLSTSMVGSMSIGNLYVFNVVK